MVSIIAEPLHSHGAMIPLRSTLHSISSSSQMWYVMSIGRQGNHLWKRMTFILPRIEEAEARIKKHLIPSSSFPSYHPCAPSPNLSIHHTPESFFFVFSLSFLSFPYFPSLLTSFSLSDHRDVLCILSQVG